MSVGANQYSAKNDMSSGVVAACMWDRHGMDMLAAVNRTQHVLGARGTEEVESKAAGPRQRVVYRAKGKGTYFVELRAARHGGGSYTLKLSKT